MPDKPMTFSEIENEISTKQDALNRIRAARQASKGYLLEPSPRFGATMESVVPGSGKRTFNLMAQGDSWFDYYLGKDLIACLHDRHGHVFKGADGSSTNLAVGGSTLNDQAYGLVPGFLGIPQSSDVSRIVELVNRIKTGEPQALLVSGGANDIAGDQFFSFIDNARSGLPPLNQDVLQGVLNTTFKNAFEYIIDNALSAAADRRMPIFVHGYDYPWPDGRGALQLGGWKIGPWLDGPFNRKNYGLKEPGLVVRHAIAKQIIDALNGMLQGLAEKYAGKVFYIDLRGTLASQDDWANELHPNNDGFASLADKIDDALQKNIN